MDESALPYWVNDLTNLLEIAVFAASAGSWLLTRARPLVLAQWFIQPQITVEEEITSVAGWALLLLFGAAFYLWIASGAETGWARLAQYALLFAIAFIAVRLVWATARLFRKIS